MCCEDFLVWSLWLNCHLQETFYVCLRTLTWKLVSLPAAVEATARSCGQIMFSASHSGKLTLPWCLIEWAIHSLLVTRYSWSRPKAEPDSHKQQHGFHPGHVTTDQLLTFSQIKSKSFVNFVSTFYRFVKHTQTSREKYVWVWRARSSASPFAFTRSVSWVCILGTESSTFKLGVRCAFYDVHGWDIPMPKKSQMCLVQCHHSCISVLCR